MALHLERGNNIQRSLLVSCACHSVYFYIVYGFNITLWVHPNHVTMKSFSKKIQLTNEEQDLHPASWWVPWAANDLLDLLSFVRWG